MKRSRNDDFFNYLINGMDSKLQAQLRFLYERDRILSEYQDRQEREQFKEEVAEYVISRIKATVDVSEIIQKIDELNKTIENLGG